MRIKSIILIIALALTGLVAAQEPITADTFAGFIGMETNHVVGCLAGFQEDYPEVGCVVMSVGASLARLQLDAFVDRFVDAWFVTPWRSIGNGYARVLDLDGQLFVFALSVDSSFSTTLLIVPGDSL